MVCMQAMELGRWTREEYDTMIAAGIFQTDDGIATGIIVRE